MVKLFNIPTEGELHFDSAEKCSLGGHGEAVVAFRFHPSAEGVVASASLDHTVRVWDVEAGR